MTSVTQKQNHSILQIEINDTKQIEVCAREYISEIFIEVTENEIYSFSTEPYPKWTDWFIKCTADGFWNIFLFNSKKRVPGQKCFKLCGTINDGSDHHFAIGSSLKNYSIPKTGRLHFFANDHYKEKYYRNNKGHVILNIKREA